MVVKSCFVGNLVGDELGVVSRNQAFVDAFDLLWVLEHVGESELGHFNVVGENVHWEIDTFGNGNKLKILSIRLMCNVVHGVLLLCKSTSSEGGKWCNPFLKSIV